MNRIMRAALAAFALALGCAPALAQSAFPTVGGSYVDGHALMCPNGSTGQNGLPIMIPCGGSATPVNVQGSFSASLGGFTPSASGARMTQLAVTTADSSGTLPTGAVAVVSNTGSNPMYCNVNAIAATTSDQLIAASSWFAFTIPSGVTALHCIATGGSTTADGLGGSGLPTGAGGGGGGSGSVPNPIGTTAAANGYADGWDVTLGTKADAAVTNPASSATGIALLKGMISTMNTGVFATSAPATNPSSAILTGGVDNTSNLSIPNPIDPCLEKKSFADLLTTASGATQLVAGSSGKHIYLCPGTVAVPSVAAHVSLVEGTGSTCTTPASVFGNNPSSVSAANGMSLAANEGMSPNGSGAFAATATTGTTLCAYTDTASQVNWHVAYVVE